MVTGFTDAVIDMELLDDCKKIAGVDFKKSCLKNKIFMVGAAGAWLTADWNLPLDVVCTTIRSYIRDNETHIKFINPIGEALEKCGRTRRRITAGLKLSQDEIALRILMLATLREFLAGIFNAGNSPALILRYAGLNTPIIRWS